MRLRLQTWPSASDGQVAADLRACGTPVETGVFAAHMQVALVNDGPVTFVVDSREER